MSRLCFHNNESGVLKHGIFQEPLHCSPGGECCLIVLKSRQDPGLGLHTTVLGMLLDSWK